MIEKVSPIKQTLQPSISKTKLGRKKLLRNLYLQCLQMLQQQLYSLPENLDQARYLATAFVLSLLFLTDIYSN